MTLLVEISKDRSHWLGQFGSLLVMVWLGEVEPDICRRLADVGQRIAARQRGAQVAVLSVALPGGRCGPPSAESRRALAQLVKDTGSCVNRVAVWRDGRGFVASVMSSVILGIQMLAKPEYGHRFFTDLDAALEWVTAELEEFRSGELGLTEARTTIEHRCRRLMSRGTTDSIAPFASSSERP